MKTYINRQPVHGPWGGGAHFVNAFHKHAPDNGVVMINAGMIGAPDVILLAGLDKDDSQSISAEQAVMYKLYQPNVKVILRVNENDARKDTSHVDRTLLRLFPHMDGIVFVSHWLQGYFRDLGWKGNNDTVIINGVDKEVFKPQPKLNNGKLNIVAHHWSDNPLKGFDIYERLDEFVGQHPDKYAFTYIGRDRRTFKHTNVVHPLHGKKLGEELGKHDIYVSASRFDPGPNHITEALACQLPTYVIRDGGGCVEFAGHDHSYRDWNDLESILMARGGPMNASFVPGEWLTCVQEYIRFLEATCRTTSESGSTSS